MRVLARLLAVPALVAGLGMAACTAEVEQEGELPEVNVEGGQLPEVDVDPARVEVSTDTQQVVTPDVNVVPTEGNDP